MSELASVSSLVENKEIIASVTDNTEAGNNTSYETVMKKRKKTKDRKKKGSFSSEKLKRSKSSFTLKPKRTYKKEAHKRKEKVDKSSSDNQNNNSARHSVKDEVCSDELHSSVSETYAPLLVTRSRIRRLERRKAYSSHSSAADSDNRKTRSEPIIITLDSDSDDNVSTFSRRPNRTARIRGELIRKLSGSPTKVNKICDSSSSSEYEDSNRKKKLNKSRSVKSSSSQIAKRKKYLVNRLANQSRLNLRKHRKHHISHVYRPVRKQRDLRSLSKRFEERKKDKPSIRSLKTKNTRSLRNLVSVERRSLRNASVDSVADGVLKTETESATLKEEEEVDATKVCPDAIEPFTEPEKTDSEIKDNEKQLKTDTINIDNVENEIKAEEQVNEAHSSKLEYGDINLETKDEAVEMDIKLPEDTPDDVKAPEKAEVSESAETQSSLNNPVRVIMKKIKKKVKPVDKIIRKRGRPRLSDMKPMKHIPDLTDKMQIPFLQSSYCFDVAPKLPKCRECLIAMKRSTRSMLHAYCRFMEYRKLCYNKNGIILNAGFSESSEAKSEHLNQWLPQLDDPPKDLNCNTSKSLLEHIGDQFCDLIEQEKEALTLHVGKQRVITWKRIVQGVREMCDVCYTTLFNFHWVCPICGLAVCIDCYKGRKQGMVVEYEEGQPKNRDQFNWLVCNLRHPHDPTKLVMAQIIPGSALWTMRDLLHTARKKYNIPSYCKCNPQEITPTDKYVSTGICKQLMSFVTKSFSAERTNLYLNGDSNVHNCDNSYDDLDIEVTGAALKWLEGTVNSNSLDNLTHADDYFDSYEDFASLRGNLLHGIPDKDIALDSEREFSSFSLDDVIECMTKPVNSEDKENSGKTLVKHFSNRYPQANSGRDPLPIRIYTKLESNMAFSNVPHSWFCNGRLLFLHQSDHKDNLALFQEQWKRGQPILVKGVDEQLNMDLWHPDAFCRDFGEDRNDLVDCMTGAVLKNLPMKKFWEGFEYLDKRMMDENGQYMLLKLKDWPPGEDFSEMLPKRFIDLMAGLPLPEYTHRNGILNLAGRLPSWFVRPDLGPKMYNAYGSALYPTKGTTNLHLDISDAVNVMVYVGIPSDGNAQLHIEEALKAIDEGGCDSLMRARVRARGAKPGALWHIYNARDADKIRDLLNKVAMDRGEKLEAHHDPIHDQSWYLDEELRKRLYKDYGVEGYAIAQCLGDAVFIPAGAPHQVRNLHSCVKVAEDFVSPENIAHCFKLTQEFRNLSDTHTNHEDKLQIKNIIFHVVRDALAHLLPDSASLDS